MRPRSAIILPALIALLPSCATNSGQGSAGTLASAQVESRDHPLGTGSVEFVGFDAAGLQDIRVIPEEGSALQVPVGSARIEDVDGFWWKGSLLWFKIPDHCHTTITMGADGQLESRPACSEFGTRIQKLRGGIAAPGWQIDSGSTGHATDYPF